MFLMRVIEQSSNSIISFDDSGLNSAFLSDDVYIYDSVDLMLKNLKDILNIELDSELNQNIENNETYILYFQIENIIKVIFKKVDIGKRVDFILDLI